MKRAKERKELKSFLTANRAGLLTAKDTKDLTQRREEAKGAMNKNADMENIELRTSNEGRLWTTRPRTF